jgi:gamma-glutamyltranspeptidase/glutathione hydrolase
MRPPIAGMMLNNMLGEEDVNPRGFHHWPVDSRLSSMMAPTLLIGRDGYLTALGSGGSNRIRSAILQVLVNLLCFGLPLDQAVMAPRLHMEENFLNVEPGLVKTSVDAALAESAAHKIWPDRNLFFGGVHAASSGVGDEPAGAGDPRRGGVVMTV